MPNEWDAFVSQPQTNARPANEDFNEFTGGADTSNFAPPEVRAARQRRRISWSQRGFGGKLAAAGRSAANSVPIFGPFLQSSNEPEIQEYRENQPLTSFATDTMAAGAPFGAAAATRAGTSGLTAMFGNMPRAMVSGGAISGADAAARGDDPVLGTGLGSMFSMLGRTGSRVITPRSPNHSEILSRTRAGRGPAILNEDMFPPGYGPEDFGPELPRQREIRQRLAQERTIAQQRNNRQLPTFSQLPPWARMTLGGVGAYGMGAHPLVGAATAYIAPPLINATRRGVNKILQSKRFDKMLNNQVMTPERRALMAAVAGQAAPEPSTLAGER